MRAVRLDHVFSEHILYLVCKLPMLACIIKWDQFVYSN